VARRAGGVIPFGAAHLTPPSRYARATSPSEWGGKGSPNRAEDSAINGECFRLPIDRVIGPTPRPGGVVGPHKRNKRNNRNK
jgi:hypothetical protein